MKEVNKILENYNLGKIIKIKELTKGYANINYKINTIKGNYLLRICREKSKKEMLYELKVLQKLSQIKFPIALPIKRKDKKFITSSKYGIILIYQFIEGKEPKINSKTIKEIAKAVAKLNSIKNWQSLKRKNAFNLELCYKLIKKFSRSKNKYPKIFKYFKKETDFLSKPLKQKVPKGLVHGDVFPGNTKFKKNKLKAIFDFEETCTDSLLFDMGVAINGFCFKNNKLDLKLLNVFLKEYNKIRIITSKEKNLLPYYIRWGAHAHLSWHLKNLLDKKDVRKLKRVNYLMNRIKKLRKQDLIL